MNIRNLVFATILTFGHLAAVAEGFITHRNVSYKDHESRCVMDIYHPEDTSKELPVIIWFHGGGLTGGNKFLPQELMGGEYVVVAPSYRLIPNVSLADCIDDAAASTAWVMDSIANYGGDPHKLFVSGHSAGGYLTSMIGLDKRWLDKYGKDCDSIAGLIPFSGQVITHFAHRERKGLSPLTPAVDDLAPLYHVRKEAPPYVIITGDREQELYGRYEENAYMWRMMKLTGHPYVYIYELDGYNHGDMAHPAHHILKAHIKELLKTK
ncbi:MAG: alpha/beta hydrolase [Clostridiales bacterium]|nr:alpha/beta hydrolase [Clostridiales bacterium]